MDKLSDNQILDELKNSLKEANKIIIETETKVLSL